MATPTTLVEHLLRRAGFGATQAEREQFSRYTYPLAVAALTDFNPEETDIDAKIGTPGYAGITTRGAFSPNTVINDSRQRWLWRMVHSPAPLQEKMALLWHHHFATAYSKIAGEIGADLATRSVATLPAAPVRFSTTTGLPQASLSPSARTRAAMSAGPPAAKPTSMRTCLSG